MSDSADAFSVVIPAHNEERTIRRTLEAVLDGLPPRAQVLVVCNGCTDSTVAVARGYAPLITVAEINEASKALALKEGDHRATLFPRIYVDADVVISGASLARLALALPDDGVAATGPLRCLNRSGAPWLVRSYYDIWEELPQVKTGLFGRGVVCLTRAAHERIATLPPLMSDDLAMSESIPPGQRILVPNAVVTVQLPRSFGDLLRRRIRVTTGNSQADTTGNRSSDAKTSMPVLLRILLGSPRLAPKLIIFLGVAVLAKIAALRSIRSGDFTTWRRDESSRQ